MLRLLLSHKLLAALAVASVHATKTSTPFAVPHVDLSDSFDARTARLALKTVGAVAVRVPNLSAARATAFADLPDCLEHDGVEATLADGTRRKTIAARVPGTEAFGSICFENDASKALRAATFTAVEAVAAALDAGGSTSALQGAHEEYDWRGVIQHGRHLEHVHAYYGPSRGEALEAHVDEGVLVAMVAGEGGTLVVTLPGGAAQELAWDVEHAILILAGDGARYLGGARPAPHALQLTLEADDTRPWYGLMVLPPDDALIEDERFEDRRMRRTASVGYVGESRQLTAVDPAATCQTQDGRDGIFCWLQCLEIDCAYGAVCLNDDDEVVPEDKHCEGHSFDNCSPVCVDPSGSLSNSSRNREGGFCRGSGQDMHMDGFRSAFEESTPPCINLYVTDWTLSTTGKYVGGMFGAFFVGFLVEVISLARKTLHRRRRSKPAPILNVGLVGLHFVQSVLGYLAMFAAMTYSIELFAAVCLGATTGYAFLHLKDAPSASTDPCCQAQTDVVLDDLDGSKSVLPVRVSSGDCCGPAYDEAKREEA